MARLRKISGSYYAYFYDRHRKPKEKSYPLRTSLKSHAEKRLRKLEEEYSTGAFDPWNPEATSAEHLTVREAEEAFLESRSHLRERTQATYAGILRRLRERLPVNLMVCDLSADHLRPFVLDKSVSVATQRKRYTHVRSFLKWLAKEEYISSNPLKDIRQPKEGEKVPEFLTPKELERLLRAIDADYDLKLAEGHAREGEILWMKDVVRLAVSTGMRQGELLHMRWSWISLEAGMITIRNSHGFTTKGGRERSIPIAGDAWEVLERLNAERETDEDDYVLKGVNGDKLSNFFVSQRFKHFVRLAKLPERIRFHSLRHTCASWLVQKGVSLPIVQAILGHSSIAVTQRYAHLAPDVLRQAMAATFGKRR